MFALTRRSGVLASLQEEAILREKLNITSTIVNDIIGATAYITNSNLEEVKDFVMHHENWEFQKIYASTGGMALPKGDTTVDEGVRLDARIRETES